MVSLYSGHLITLHKIDYQGNQ